MPKTKSHKWIFAAKFRKSAFGWRGSRLACQRIKEAISEIKKTTRKNPLLGAEGVVKLMEKLWPALQHVDSSSGVLGTAVYNAVCVLVDIVVDVDVDDNTRAKWMDRLWDAFNEDGVGYLDVIGERWGEICGSPDTASKWANELQPVLRSSWEETKQGAFSYFRGTGACLSCLLAAGRHQELLGLIEMAPHVSWHNRKYGVRALVAMGKKGKAIKYAKDSCGLNDNPSVIGQACEDILLSSGLYEEAYRQYGLKVNRSTTNLATFRKIVNKYPMVKKSQILRDLIAATPGEEGKWFATAKTLGELPLALKLSRLSPCDPKTLHRAARDYLEKDPRFALGVAMSSIYWLSQGWGYEVTGVDVQGAYDYAMLAANKLGMEDQILEDIAKIAKNDKSPGMFVKGIIRENIPS